MVSSTSNDCANGSPLSSSNLTRSSKDCVWYVLEVLEVVVLSSVLVLCDISAFLTIIISSWTVLRVPSARKLAWHVDALSRGARESVTLLLNLNVLVPVVNSGADVWLGLGINNDPIKAPLSSVINLLSVTVASAPLVRPKSFISLEILPW